MYKFDANPITNSKMVDKVAVVEHYNWLYLNHFINIETSLFHWILRNDSAHQL